MSFNRVLLGVILLAIGVLLALDAAEVMAAGDIVSQWWPAIFIVLGLVEFISSRMRNYGALFVVVLGAVLLVATLDLVPGDVSAYIGPLVLVAIGVWVLFGRSSGRRVESADSVRSISAFGGAEIAQRSQQFAGGMLIQLFGGTTLDLRQARLADDGASIDALAAFGGVDIIVPRDWSVAVSGIPIFGSLDNKVDDSGEAADALARLSVNGLALFGGVEVKFEP